jgi:hypothetical protein
MTKRDFADRFIDNVKGGKVPGFSVDPDNPALQYEAMDIASPRGTKVRFTGYGGYEFEQKLARTLLTVDAVYTVERTEIGAWSTDVFLNEVPGKSFNSVMFAARREPRTGHEQRLTEAVAQALLNRFRERCVARGSEMPCAARINECVPSYRDDFIADAAAAIETYRNYEEQH